MVNETILQGRLVADPELKSTQSGVLWCDFTVAWSKKYKENEEVCFMPCRAWRQSAEFVSKYFGKGDQIAIVGKMVTQSWQDKDGQKKSKLLCKITEANFCGSKSQAQSQPAAGMPGMDTPQFEILENEEELPF